MHRFSKAIYLETRELIAGGDVDEVAEARRRVLRECEEHVERMSAKGQQVADPARALFAAIRYYFPIREQERVYHVVSSYMAAAKQFMEREAAEAAKTPAPTCKATTRKGRACPRSTVNGSAFCPAHAHLASVLG